MTSSANPPRIAIAQIAMHWTTADNLAAMLSAARLARRFDWHPQ
jgi:hypothetical protein